jgi:RNA recognition motif-containing protein
MTDKDLNDLFRPLRKICDVRVAVDRRTGQPRGFAHADFMDVQSAVAAKKALEGRAIHGRDLQIDYAITRERPTPQRPLAAVIAEQQTKTTLDGVEQSEITDAIESSESPVDDGAISQPNVEEDAVDQKAQSAA